MNWTRKRTASLILSLMLGLTIFNGCGAPAATEPATSSAAETTTTANAVATESSQATESAAVEPAKDVTLQVWLAHPYKANYQELLSADPNDKYGILTKKVVDAYESANPGVKVSLADNGWDEALKQKLLISVMGGTGPDVTMGEAYIPEFARIGAFLPIDMAGIKEQLFPGSISAAYYDGQYYGVSAYTGVFALQYNKKVMKEAGLDPEVYPKTWDELLQMSKQITEAGKGSYAGMAIGAVPDGIGSAFRYAVFMRQMGGAFINDDLTEITLNSEANIKAMEYWRELAKQTLPRQLGMTDWGQILSLTHKNQAAFQIDGPWQIDWTKGDENNDCAYAPIPVSADGKRANLIVGNAIFSALQSSKNPDEAVEFVKMMADKELQLEAYRADARIPSNKEAAQSPEIIQTRPEMAVFIDELLNSDCAPLPAFSQNASKIWDVCNVMWAEVTTGDKPIQDILNEAQAKAMEFMK